MFIKSLYYNNRDINWELKKVDFDVIALFLGLSGSGKSLILEAIYHLKKLALGNGRACMGSHVGDRNRNRAKRIYMVRRIIERR